MKMVLDFHDDSNDCKFLIRGVHSSGQDPDVITTRFSVVNDKVGVGIASPTSTLDVGGVIKANGTNSAVWVSGDGSIYRNYSSGSGAGIHLTGNAVLSANSSGAVTNGGVDFGNGSYLWARMFSKYGFFLDDYYQSNMSQWIGKRYNNNIFLACIHFNIT